VESKLIQRLETLNAHREGDIMDTKTRVQGEPAAFNGANPLSLATLRGPGGAADDGTGAGGRAGGLQVRTCLVIGTVP